MSEAPTTSPSSGTVPIDPGVDIGHVHLKVADIDRALAFYHVAIRYPTRRALADALRRLVEAGVPLQGASDHGVSEALYLADPDGNGVELCWDRPRAEWPRSAGGELAMVTDPLDVRDLLAELEA
jgi:catechol 2,3-dioxygenase